MSQITLNIPERFDAYIAAKMSEGYPSPESVILEAMQIVQVQEEEQSKTCLPGMSDKQRQAVEQTLENRLEGPFEPLSENWTEEIMARVMQRLATERAHA